MTDTLKVTAGGLGSATIIGLGVLPDMISVAVGVVTIIYFCIKIYKEFK